MKAPLQTRPKTSSTAHPTFAPFQRGLLQRKCACGGTPGPSGDCETCRAKKMQRRSENLNPSSISHPPSSVSEVPPIVHEVIRSPGQPLDSDTRAFMEPRFGCDFSRVRVHSDARAVDSAKAVNAQAYTVGQNVVFSEKPYPWGNNEGRGLLAHELVHTVQQSNAGGSGENLTLGQNEPAEREAEAVAHAVLSDDSTQISKRPGTVLQRQAAPAPSYRITPTSSDIPSCASGLRTIKVWLNTFIPMAIVGPYAGDNREFSSDIQASHRTHQEIEFETKTLRKTIDYRHVGTSHIMMPSSLLPPGIIPPIFLPPYISVASGTASTNTLANGTPQPSGGAVVVHFSVDSANPLAPGAPAINLEADFSFDMAARTCHLTGSHDGFPAYEAYVTANGGSGETVYGYDPRTTGEGPTALWPPMDKSISTKEVSF